MTLGPLPDKKTHNIRDTWASGLEDANHDDKVKQTIVRRGRIRAERIA